MLRLLQPLLELEEKCSKMAAPMSVSATARMSAAAAVTLTLAPRPLLDKTGRCKSKIWKYFGDEEGNIIDPQKITCRSCRHNVTTATKGGNTFNLAKHLQTDILPFTKNFAR